MRKLAWFAAGFAAACFVGAYLLGGFWLAILGAICAVCSVCSALFKSKSCRIVAVAFLGAAVAFVWFFAFDAIFLSNIRQLDNQVVHGDVQITDYSYEARFGITADGKLELDGKYYRIRVYMDEKISLSPGDSVAGELRLRYTARGGLDEMTYHQGKGIFLLGYFEDGAVVTGGNPAYMEHFAANLRRDIQNILNTIFPEDTLAFARAMLLGDSSLLDYKTKSDLSVSGIRHIIAVSGLHVTILFSVIFTFFGYRRVLTPLIGIPVLVVFAALAGFTPSVVRACIMQGLILLSLAVDKEYDPPTALGFSVLVMLAVNPLTITSVSFQLSVGCMIGILGFSAKIRTWLLHEKRLGPAKGKSIKSRLLRWLCGSISVTLGAMVVTTPLCGWYFGMVSLVGILTNLLCLWVVTALFCAIVAACIAGPLLPVLGKVIAWIASWLIRYVLLASDLMASLPVAAVYTDSVYIVIWLVFCYIFLGVFLFSKGKRVKPFATCVLAGILVALVLSWLEPRLDPYRMTVLDVGEGQCILLQADDRYYLVDCGGDSESEAADKAAAALLSQGVRELDGVILTHYDIDHAGGVYELLCRVPAQKLYLPNLEDEGDICSELEATSAQICWVEPEMVMEIDNGLITLYAGKEGASDNESSLCVLFQPENCDILIMSDRSAAGEKVLLEQTQLPDLEVLVVGHHGSKTSTSLELLHTTRPELAVISVSGQNNYNHPAQQVLARLARYGCRVVRTDQSGDIIIKG